MFELLFLLLLMSLSKNINLTHKNNTTALFFYSDVSTVEPWRVTDVWQAAGTISTFFFKLLHFPIPEFSFRTRASTTTTTTTTTSTLQALQLPPSTRPACTHSALRRGLMSNKHWVTTDLESSQLSQMPNWSLEVLHNAKQHSLKLGVKKKSQGAIKCKNALRCIWGEASKWCRWIIRTLRCPLVRNYKM